MKVNRGIFWGVNVGYHPLGKNSSVLCLELTLRGGGDQYKVLVPLAATERILRLFNTENFAPRFGKAACWIKVTEEGLVALGHLTKEEWEEVHPVKADPH